MGCDGGFIPRRVEMVKTKAKAEQLDDSEILRTQWTCCFISKKPLERPIVACKLGRLYNKDSVVMFLLNRQESVDNDVLASELAHIKSLKNLINCNLKSSESKESEYFVCPVTGREMNGKSKFYVTRLCGCVLSEQALNQFPDTKACLVCERKDFNRETDLIPLYPTGEELEKLKGALKLEEDTCKIKKKRPATNVPVTESSNTNFSPLLNEIKSTKEIGALKKSKVTETLYHKK